MADAVVIAAPNEENTGYRFSWGLAIAGGIAATAVTFFLLTLGSGFGLLLVHPLTYGAAVVPSFLTGGAIYFFVAQAFGFAIGGHLAGRLLGYASETPAQEDFRAGAHGFAAWAVTVLATITMFSLAGLAAGTAATSTAALYGSNAHERTESTPTAYLVDQLFRPSSAASVSATPESTAARAEAGRIVNAGLVRGDDVAPSDRARLIGLTARESGLTAKDAAGRIDQIETDVRTKTRKAADITRKAASYASLWIAFSLLFGAVVATFAAVFARHEDDRQMARAR